MSLITQKDLVAALPSTMKGVATQNLADTLNQIQADPEIAEHIRNNFLSYSKVLTEGKFKIEDYMNAIVFASWRMAGKNNLDSYTATFPDRYARMMAAGKSSKDISATVSMYAKGKLVVMILEQAAIPIWLLNQDVVQKAINIQLDLAMDTSQSGMVRTTAANSLLNHLQRPKENITNNQINVNLPESDGIAELRRSIEEISKMQIKAIEAGATTKEIAAMDIKDVSDVELSNERT
ncbi:terminase small subunit [Alcaligenes phage vB_Af_QDWS595]|uniref:Terminase small subunit n=1 Tax=Alcaligenes phage vB_Af_QDWS595 TaxID=2877946 RepID=A0AAE8Y667_9CAUD|nr:terminase small subunit [Alcaligenes phage vB_Af_QDWS595]UCR75491.1 terminase small subunit [Alcaligenes phage vB_Af_QDWS595]